MWEFTKKGWESRTFKYEEQYVQTLGNMKGYF